MNKILSNIFKGLLVALVIVVTGGIISLNLKVSPNSSMVLVSSSLVNSLNTQGEKVEFVEVPKLENKVETSDEVINENKEKEEDKNTKTEVKEETVDSKKQEEKQEVKEEVKEEVKQEEVKEPVKEEVKEQPQVQTPPTPSIPNANGNYAPNNDTAAASGVTATYTGLVTAYGPDCYGCYGGKTAMGDYVGEGNIYYNHPTYGNIRIVAGDRSILNKVVRITGLNISSEPVIAIVRDTGGDIGFNKPKGIILDLLFTSEKSQEVLNFGMQHATVEVLN